MDVLLGALEEIRTPDLLIRSQTLYPTELPAQVQDIYYHRHRGLSTVFFKKMNFFSRRKKSRRKPRFAAAGTLSFGPGAPAVPSLSNAGMAFPSPPEAAQLFPYSFSGRNCPRYPPPDAALSFFPRRALLYPLSLVRGGASLSLSCRACNCRFSPARDSSARFPLPGTGLFAFPAGGRHGPCLVPGKKARLCPVLPFCRARRQGCTPRQKQKARPPPKGWPDRCVSLSGDEAQVSDQALGLPNWQSLLPESEVHISSMFRGSL